MQIAAPIPFPDLRLAFAALAARAGEIGALVVTGALDYYFHRRLTGALARLIAKLRIALLHRAFALLPTLRAYQPRPERPQAPRAPLDPFEPEAAAAAELEPRDPAAMRPSGIVLWPVGRHGVDNSEGRQPYYWMPAGVPAARLARRFEAVARILADPDRYARKLAMILSRPPRGAPAEPEPCAAPEADRAPPGAPLFSSEPGPTMRAGRCADAAPDG
jgi:hypothetical protein